jgi:hypothetical protein
MDQTKIIKLVAVVLLIIVVGIVSFFFGDKHALETLTIKRITPDQAASAMQGDHFYTDYRENTLLISGTVSSISTNNNDSVVTFKTSSAFKTVCDFKNLRSAIHPGETITALSEGGSAERQTSAVLLQDCTLLN